MIREYTVNPPMPRIMVQPSFGPQAVYLSFLSPSSRARGRRKEKEREEIQHGGKGILFLVHYLYKDNYLVDEVEENDVLLSNRASNKEIL